MQKNMTSLLKLFERFSAKGAYDRLLTISSMIPTQFESFFLFVSLLSALPKVFFAVSLLTHEPLIQVSVLDSTQNA